MAGKPHPKPPKRVVDRDAVREKLLSDRSCRLCGKRGKITVIGDRTYVAGLSGHHIVPRGQGGDDVPENIVPLCGDGVRGCHGEVETNKRWIRVTLRSHLREDEIKYVIGKKGWAWMERRYPRHITTDIPPNKFDVESYSG